MKYDVIFYISKKTSYCEKILSKLFSKIDIESNRTLYSTTPEELGNITVESLNLTNIVVIIGGLSASKDRNLSTILSRVLSVTGLSLKYVRKLKSENETGYLITYKKQMIIALPDSYEDIEEMINDELLSFIKKKLS